MEKLKQMNEQIEKAFSQNPSLEEKIESVNTLEERYEILKPYLDDISLDDLKMAFNKLNEENVVSVSGGVDWKSKTSEILDKTSSGLQTVSSLASVLGGLISI